LLLPSLLGFQALHFQLTRLTLLLGKPKQLPLVLRATDPSYPKLAGQHKDFLVRALMDYKSGARKNAIMSAQAAQLTKADMQNISAYFASLPGQIETRK
jgi:hypothetical protein